MSTSVIGGNIGHLYAMSITLNPAIVAAVAVAEQDFTVPGVLAGDMIASLSMTTATPGLGVAGYRVKANNIVSVTFVNPTAAAIDAAAGNFKLLMVRLESEFVGGLPS